MRSAAAFCVVLSLFPLGMVPFYLVVVPLAWLRPELRGPLAQAFVRGMAQGLSWALELGGARFRRTGTIPTEGPTLIVGNHQSLVDILSITLMSRPHVPVFVTRARYARWVPLVSPCVRMIDCPVVAPRKDAKAAVEAVRDGARRLKNGLLIFPEGHRSRDGHVLPFRRSGLEAIFATRRLPIYLVATDGLWRARALVDFVFNIHRLDGRVEVFGPFEAPEDPERWPAFIEELRQRIVDRIAAMQVDHDAA